MDSTKIIDTDDSSSELPNSRLRLTSVRETDIVLLSDTSLDSIDQSNSEKCAVALCTENVRKQFDKLFFIKFPKDDLELCNKWWKICDRYDEFDPMASICSIHFNSNDFNILYERRDTNLYRQTVLKTGAVPTLYIHSMDYTKFARKRKHVEKIESPIESVKTIKCAVKSCKNMFSKGDNKLLFFKFPLKNKLLLKKWIDNIKLHDWRKPLDCDRICSDHFEKDCVIINKNVYELKKNAIPLITPKNAFVMKPKNNVFEDYRKLIGKQFTKSNLNTPKIVHSTDGEINKIKHKNGSQEFMGQNIEKVFPVEKSKIICSKEKMLLPKSTNPGNLDDYIYLDTLQFGHGDLLSFEQKRITKSNLFEYISDDRETTVAPTPSSIIFNTKLTESRGIMLPPICDPDCKKLCNCVLTDFQRKKIFNHFHDSINTTEQNHVIVQLIKLCSTKKANGKFETRPLFHLSLENKRIPVCETFFINTLGITKNRVDAILMPDNYTWFSSKANVINSYKLPFSDKHVVDKSQLTDFAKNSLALLKPEEKLFELETPSEALINVDEIPFEVIKTVLTYIKSIPRVLTMYKYPESDKSQCFEVSIRSEFMYNNFSQPYIKSNTKPPCTKGEFKKIYNKYMRGFMD